MLRVILAVLFTLALGAPLAAAQPAPPPPPPGMEAGWYYVGGNRAQGPYTLPEMQDMATRGIIRASTQVYDPRAGWAFAKDTPALQPYLGEPVAGPPPAAPRPPPVDEPRPPTDYETLERETRVYLLGGWRMVATDTVGTQRFEVTVRYEFRADGSFVGVMSTRMPSSPDVPEISEPMDGVWTVRALNARELIISLDRRNGLEPDILALERVGDDVMASRDGRNRYERVY